MTFTKICTDFFLNQLDSAEYLHSLLQITCEFNLIQNLSLALFLRTDPQHFIRVNQVYQFRRQIWL